MLQPTSQPRDSRLGQVIGRLVVGAVLPIVGLFVLRLILKSLPLIKNAAVLGDTGLTPVVLIAAAIDTLIYVLIVRCASGIARAVREWRPYLADVPTLITLAGAALVATLAYSGYTPLLVELAPDQLDVYNWVFLIVVLAPITAIVVLVTRRLSFFTDLLFSSTQSSAPASVPFAPTGLPPVANPELDQVRSRTAQVAAAVEQAKLAYERAGGLSAVPADVTTAAANMENYLAGTAQYVARGDANEAKRCLDWAEYEASRVAAACRA